MEGLAENRTEDRTHLDIDSAAGLQSLFVRQQDARAHHCVVLLHRIAQISVMRKPKQQVANQVKIE